MDRIRLFRSPLLERLTLTRPLPVACLWLSIAAALVLWSTLSPEWRLLPGLGWAVAGMFFWTLFEYGMHRVLFHWSATSDAGRHAVFVMHGGHHAQPEDEMRGLMPPLASVPIAVAVFALAALVLDPPWLQSAFSGFTLGYLAFDMIHWATHHARPAGPIGRAIKRYHLRHHFDRRPGNFGVSTPLWDIVFGTRLLGAPQPASPH